THLNRACVWRLSADTWPEAGHVRDVFCGGTTMRCPPAHASLYSSCRRNSNQPWSRMALFRPDLARTCFPGCSGGPAADLDMFRTCKTSIHTTARVWLIARAVL